jgi:peptidyl-prolyl cis-trans isomerase B (cyclophilin B)
MSYLKNLFFVFLLVSSVACAGDKDYVVTIETRHGNVVALLFDDTPEHKSNFIKLAEEGRFDSTEFHRIIKGFMVQGGDVFGKEGLAAEKWPTIPAEILPHHFHKKGMIAAARQGNNINPERRSNGSQFYIVQGKVYTENELITDMQALQDAFMRYVQIESQQQLRNEYKRLYEEGKFDSLTTLLVSKRDEIAQSLSLKLTKDFTPEQIKAYTTVGGTPHLDQEYTVFGEVIKGMEVVEKIASEPTLREVPVDRVFMKVKVERISKKKITKEYGYQYPDAN